MRWVLTAGLISSLTFQLAIPVSAIDPFTTGVAQGFTAGLGWELSSMLGRGLVKVKHAFSRRKQKYASAETDYRQNMGPEDYYNFGLEDGYARAREDYSRSAESNYLREPNGRYHERRHGSSSVSNKASVRGRKLAQSRSGSPQQNTSQKGLRATARSLDAVNGRNSTHTLTGSRTARQPSGGLSRSDRDSTRKQDVASQPELP